MPCSRTQHGLTRVGLEPPTSGSGVRGINHQATALPDFWRGLGKQLMVAATHAARCAAEHGDVVQVPG